MLAARDPGASTHVFHADALPHRFMVWKLTLTHVVLLALIANDGQDGHWLPWLLLLVMGGLNATAAVVVAGAARGVGRVPLLEIDEDAIRLRRDAAPAAVVHVFGRDRTLDLRPLPGARNAWILTHSDGFAATIPLGRLRRLDRPRAAEALAAWSRPRA